MDQYQDARKKVLIYNVIEFLSNEVHKSNLTEERKESVEVAIQCLETAYEIDGASKDKLEKVDLLSNIKVPEKTVVTAEQIATAEHYKNLGNNAMKNGKYDEAVTEYSKAIEANSQNAVYFCNRAAAFSRLDRQHDAIKDCKEAIRLDPTYGKAYGRLGIAYSNLNMYNEAKQAYATALEFDPTNAMYETNMRLAQERVMERESTAPPQHRPIDISQFINHDSFLQMAREMMSNPEFHNIMSGIMAMSQSGDTNLETLFQAGQNLASRMQDTDPNFVENLRRSFESTTGSGQPNPDDGANAKKPEDPNNS